ncbi:MAG: ABC transporter ATP-binding protein [Calditrichaeota bacterium]|nr:MAG: ABC transporter ATP-binding protein [Calditrichota bacterium]
MALELGNGDNVRAETCALPREISDAQAAKPLLQITDLSIDAVSEEIKTPIVQHVSFDVAANETLALIGESGSGKTMTALATLGLLPKNLHASGAVNFKGVNLLASAESELNRLRGRSLALIFQNAKSAFNPTFRIGTQITDVMRTHLIITKKQAKERALDFLTKVGLPDPASVFRAYPHQLSGGMAQRAMIALGLSCNPELVIADEPTSALDRKTQTEIVELLQNMQRNHGFGLWLISHNLALILTVADKIAVMKEGRIVEYGLSANMLAQPADPYTRKLLNQTKIKLV